MNAYERPSLNPFETAVLRALAEACNYAESAHPPEHRILAKFPTHLRGDARKALKKLHKLGLCHRHGGQSENYNITRAGIFWTENI